MELKAETEIMRTTDADHMRTGRLLPDLSEPEVLPPNAEGDSLGYLQSIYRDPSMPPAARMRAAIAVLPFERPKLAVTALINGEGFADRLEKAIARSVKMTEALPIQASDLRSSL
jgi:hypothetical protein